ECLRGCRRALPVYELELGSLPLHWAVLRFAGQGSATCSIPGPARAPATRFWRRGPTNKPRPVLLNCHRLQELPLTRSIACPPEEFPNRARLSPQTPPGSRSLAADIVLH